VEGSSRSFQNGQGQGQSPAEDADDMSTVLGVQGMKVHPRESPALEINDDVDKIENR